MRSHKLTRVVGALLGRVGSVGGIINTCALGFGGYCYLVRTIGSLRYLGFLQMLCSESSRLSEGFAMFFSEWYMMA